MALPKSVRVLNVKLAPWGDGHSRWKLGQKLHNLLTTVRELHDAFNVTNSGSVTTLINELKELRDHEVLNDPGLAQATTTTRFQIVNATNYKIAGVFYQKAATDNIQLTAAMNTAAAQYRSVLVQLDAAGAVSFVISAIATSAPVALPAKEDDKCAIGSIQIPASFVADTTVVQTAWCTDGVPSATAALADMVATKPESLPDIDM